MHTARFLIIGTMSRPVVWHGDATRNLQRLPKPKIVVHCPKDQSVVYRILGEDDTAGCPHCEFGHNVIDERPTS